MSEPIEEKKKHISISQIGMAKRCPRQYVYRYVEGKKSPPGIALIVGSSFDEAYNMDYGQKVESHENLPYKEVQEKFASELDQRSQELKEEDKDQVPKVKDTITSGIRVFHRQVAQKVQPTEVQKELRIPYDDEYDLLGYADVITETSLVDNKTAARYTAGKYRTQLEAYVYMYHKLTGEVKDAELHYLIKTKEPKTQIEKLEGIDPTLFLYNETPSIKFIQQLRKTPEIGVKNTESWMCSPKWCGFYNECQGGK